jgi:hypothetical protein
MEMESKSQPQDATVQIQKKATPQIKSVNVLNQANNNNAKSMTKKMVSDDLKRAVDWKLFEISSLLIDRHVDGADFEESFQWFQARHAEEVVEERTNEGLCGYPLCKESLSSAKLNHSKYRIDYKDKKIYEVDKSAFYCSSKCLEKTEIWLKNLDMTVPYSRPVVKSLNLEEFKKATIEDVLDLLSLQEEQEEKQTKPQADKQKNNTKKPNNGSTKPLPPPPIPETAENAPPLFSSPYFDENGEIMNLEFQNGKPVIAPLRADQKPRSHLPKNNNKIPFQPEQEETTAPPLPLPVPPPAAVAPFMPKKIAERRKQQEEQHKTEDDDDVEEVIRDKDHHDDIHKSGKERDREQEEQEEPNYDNPTYLSQRPQELQQQTHVHQTEVSTTIEEIMKTMRNLQYKHGLLPPGLAQDKEKTIVIGGAEEIHISPSKKTTVTTTSVKIDPKKEELWQNEISLSQNSPSNSSIDNNNNINNNNKKNTESPHVSPMNAFSTDSFDETNNNRSVNAESVHSTTTSTNNNKKKKIVEWNIPEDTKQPPPANNSNPPPSVSKTASLSPSSKKSPAVTQPILGMTVRERTQVAPLSERAILTKKEPPQAVAPQQYYQDLFQNASFYSQSIEGHYFPQQSATMTALDNRRNNNHDGEDEEDDEEEDEDS